MKGQCFGQEIQGFFSFLFFMIVEYVVDTVYLLGDLKKICVNLFLGFFGMKYF